MVALSRTKDKPWKLKTAPGTSEYTMHVDNKDGAKVRVCELEHAAKGIECGHDEIPLLLNPPLAS